MSSSGQNQNELQKALLAVERLLKIRIRSRHELKTRLEEKYFSAETIKAIITRYEELGLVDDKLFAEQWIQSRLKKPYGRKRIEYELIQKGVNKHIITACLDNAFAEFEEQKTVLNLAKHQAAKYKPGLKKNKLRQRLYAYLSRRGFSSTAIFHAINHYED